jgi:hypothetical protein
LLNVSLKRLIKNLILFLEPREERGELLRIQRQIISPRTARYQAQDIGTYNPDILCRVFAAFERQTTAVISWVTDNCSNIAAVFV